MKKNILIKPNNMKCVFIPIMLDEMQTHTHTQSMQNEEYGLLPSASRLV